MNNEDLILQEVGALILFLSRMNKIKCWSPRLGKILDEAVDEASSRICRLHRILGTPAPIDLEEPYDVFNNVYSTIYATLNEHRHLCDKVSEFFSPDLLLKIDVEKYKDIEKIITFFDSKKVMDEIMPFLFSNFIFDRTSCELRPHW